MGFMHIFGWFYATLVNEFGIDIAPAIIKLCEKILSIPGIENLLNLV